MVTAILSATLLAASSPLAEVSIPQPSEVAARAFVGDVANQHFINLRGRLRLLRHEGRQSIYRCRLSDPQRRRYAISFTARCQQSKLAQRWSFMVVNDENNTTICQVTFPTVAGVRLSDDWTGERIVWPSLYQGALLSDLTSQQVFVSQAKQACKGLPYLHGRYQGDLCLPFFVHLGQRGSFGIMVLDPTHEVVSLDGFRDEDGMRYTVTVYPRIPPGHKWSFGEVEVFASPVADWHIHADRYRQWLVEQGFKRPGPDLTDVATFNYGRWDGLLTEEIIRWCQVFDIRDVGMWQQLFGHGDQYYPCYFPPPKVGVEGMKKKLAELRRAGLQPYFYTNYYLLSPLQTAEDALEWSRKHPKQYPQWLAKGDKGYAEAVRWFRSQGYDFADPWLHQRGGILPLRVRRVDFKWGEFPVYFWHRRPFYVACVAAPQWRKLFADVAQLHAQMGARGIYMDQLAAMHPELCSAPGHSHDHDSFGMWNRAALRLAREVKEAGSRVAGCFFIEAEGAADLYARYVDRFLCWFDEGPKLGFPQLLHYTVPWLRADVGTPKLKDPDRTRRLIERTFLVGATFRIGGGGPTGPFDPNASVFTTEAAKMLRAAIRTRRRLKPLMDEGRFMDTVNLSYHHCSAATWFQAPAGVLVVAIAQAHAADVTLSKPPPLEPSQAWAVDWKTNTRRPASASAAGDGAVRIANLSPGLNLIVLPARP